MNRISNIVFGAVLGLIIGIITGFFLMNANLDSLKIENDSLVNENIELESTYSNLLSDYQDLKLQEIMFTREKKILTDRSEGRLRVINMTASQFEFTPDLIEADFGDIIVLRIWSTLDRESGYGKHGFALIDWFIDETLPKDTWTTIIFVADKQGEFYFGCQHNCGTDHANMLGRIIIN